MACTRVVAFWVLFLCALLLAGSQTSCGSGGGAPPAPPGGGDTKNDAWLRTGGPMGGLGYDVRIDPDDPDTMYVTDKWAGVFKSTDGGRTWAPRNTGITTRVGPSGDAIPVFCLTIDPIESQRIWSGTEGLRGIFLSTDGATTWVKRDNGVVEDEGITFRGITIDPTSSDVVYAAGEIASYVWGGEIGHEFDKTEGVVYRTTDGGLNWEAIWRGNNLARYVWIDPRDTDVLYISTGIFDREAADSDYDTMTPGGEGILKSTDGGVSWQNINTGLTNLYVNSLFMHPTDPDTLIAGTGNNTFGQDAGVFITTNGGASWARVGAPAIDAATAVEICASDPDIVYAGNAGAVFRSLDGGTTWEKATGDTVGWGAPGVDAGFPIDIAVDPRDPGRVFVNNYGGGNFLSPDGGATWSVASDGYTGAQVRSISVDHSASGRVYAAARSGIFRTDDGGTTWAGLGYFPAVGLEWTAVAVDPEDGLHVLAASNILAVICESRDGGFSWEWTVGSNVMEGHGIRVIAFAPSDTNVVYAGTSAYRTSSTFDPSRPAEGVRVSRDGGTSWEPANDPLSQDAHVTALAIDPTSVDHVFAATTTKGLLVTTNGGGTWAVAGTGLPAGKSVTSVAIDPANNQAIYAGIADSGLYRSIDAGTTWNQVVAGVQPESSVSDIVFQPGTVSVICISDPLSGVYRSTDGGATWLPLNKELRTRAVNDLDFSSDGRHLYAATEGEGLFRLDLFGTKPP